MKLSGLPDVVWSFEHMSSGQAESYKKTRTKAQEAQAYSQPGARVWSWRYGQAACIYSL